MEFSGQYLTYEEYRSLGGTLDLTPFNLLEYEARRQIDKNTMSRLKNSLYEKLPTEVRLCMFNLINNIQKYKEDEDNNKLKSSETVGSYSVTYKNVRDIVEQKEEEITNDIVTNLFGVVYNGEHLIYCGV